MRNALLWLCVLPLTLVLCACAHEPDVQDEQDGGTVAGSRGPARTPEVRFMTKRVGDEEFTVKLLFEDDFENLDNWIAESKGTVTAGDHELIWDCEGEALVGTIWCKQRFEGPTIVEYDVATLAGTDNINFLFYADREGGLLETTGERTGSYNEYHLFPNYIITYLTNKEPRWRVRFRKDPGFNLLSETFVDRPVGQPQKQHITYVFEADGTMSLYSDGRLLHRYRDEDNPYRSGYHGFRTWNSKLKYSNFKVWGIVQD